MPGKNTSFYRWEDLQREKMGEGVQRRFINGERMTLAHIYLERGSVLPRHAHENEQFTYVIQGALRLWLGEDDAEEIVVSAGEVLHIPANVPHRAEALEDTLDAEIFSPPRQEWLR